MGPRNFFLLISILLFLTVVACRTEPGSLPGSGPLPDRESPGFSGDEQNVFPPEPVRPEPVRQEPERPEAGDTRKQEALPLFLIEASSYDELLAKYAPLVEVYRRRGREVNAAGPGPRKTSPLLSDEAALRQRYPEEAGIVLAGLLSTPLGPLAVVKHYPRSGELRLYLDDNGVKDDGVILDGDELDGAGGRLDLAGRTIAIDSGHGGWDTGGIALDGVPEKEYNHILAGALAEELHSRGARLLWTNPDGRDTYTALEERARLAAGADLLISIHHDVAPQEELRGFALFYSSYRPRLDDDGVYVMVEGRPREFVSQKIQGGDLIIRYRQSGRVVSFRTPRYGWRGDPFVRDRTPCRVAEASRRLAYHLAFQLNEVKGHQPYRHGGRLVNDRDYRLLRLSPVPAVIIEAGFLTNPEDWRRLREAGFRGALVRRIADGISGYFATIDQEAPL